MACFTPQIGKGKFLILKDLLDLKKSLESCQFADAKNRFKFVARKIFREYRQDIDEHLSGVVNFN